MYVIGAVVREGVSQNAPEKYGQLVGSVFTKTSLVFNYKI